mgnify:CR=1 FL=1
MFKLFHRWILEGMETTTEYDKIKEYHIQDDKFIKLVMNDGEIYIPFRNTISFEFKNLKKK